MARLTRGLKEGLKNAGALVIAVGMMVGFAFAAIFGFLVGAVFFDSIIAAVAAGILWILLVVVVLGVHDEWRYGDE